MKKLKMFAITSVSALFLMMSAISLEAGCANPKPPSYDNDGWCNAIPDGFECQSWGSVGLPNCDF